MKIWVQNKKKYAIMFGMCMGKINLKANLISDESSKRAIFKEWNNDRFRIY